jgi:hypothetical protein
MRRFAALLAASAVWLAAGAHPVRAQDAEPTKPPPPAEALPPPPEFTLTANVVDYDSERDLYEATGNVKIVQVDGRVLTADWVLFNGSTRTGVASGDVVVSGAQNTVRAQFVAVDLRSDVSVALRGAMDNPVPGFIVNGEVIERTGVDTFEIERGNFTTCRCPPEDERRPFAWVSLDPGDDDPVRSAKGPMVQVLDVPVLYVPGHVPEVERQSGFPVRRSRSRAATAPESPAVLLGAAQEINDATPGGSAGGAYRATQLEMRERRAGVSKGGGFRLLARKVPTAPTTFGGDNRWAYWLRHRGALSAHSSASTRRRSATTTSIRLPHCRHRPSTSTC